MNTMQQSSSIGKQAGHCTVIKRKGSPQDFSNEKINYLLGYAASGLEEFVDRSRILSELEKNIFAGITTRELSRALVLSVVPFIQDDPAYDTVAMRLLLVALYKEVFNISVSEETLELFYRQNFVAYLQKGVDSGMLDSKLLREFDLVALAAHLQPDRDRLFEYMGLQTLHEKYLIKAHNARIELPQYFWMRIAMGLALGEAEHKTAAACRFYDLISQLLCVPGTPTLLHAGTRRSQLSSCYLTTVSDDLIHIFKCLADNAQLSKYSGGVANDWTPLRATGALIKSIDVNSQGVIPFLKLVNDVTSVINRSGKRRGATCVYLETWHYDIEDFLDLRRNTGDERRRTHDINTANWIPDLFMQRMQADADWTLFSPHDTPDLHDLYGQAFKARYEQYEGLVADGIITQYKVVKAKQLWKKMLTRLFETGHPWITFKDAFNIRSPQDHAGVIHSTNLCTEIGLNTSAEETAVCNLASINLARHIANGVLDEAKLAATIETTVRMLDNVIDINFYPTKEAEVGNLRHRPIGLGVMGLQDALYQCDIPFDDVRARAFCDESMETISYYTILASSRLAKERGAYSSYRGSKWDRGLFPIDTLDLLEKERGEKVTVDRKVHRDWSPVREHVRQYGMRNSNTMAIAPTATISNISGCYPCIEPIYKNLYVKANQQGEFTIINSYLVKDLARFGLWTPAMQQKLKYYDGSIQQISEIPEALRRKYKTAFELDPAWLIELTAVRAKWIDQSQSHNVFVQGASGKQLNDLYVTAWQMGLKATYYLRTLGATQIEKSTLDAKQFGFTQKRQYDAPLDAQMAVDPVEAPKSCSIENPSCESCQ